MRIDVLSRRHDGSDGVSYWTIPRSTLIVGVWRADDGSWYWSNEDETEWRDSGGPCPTQRQAKTEAGRAAFRRIARRIEHASNMDLIKDQR